MYINGTKVMIYIVQNEYSLDIICAIRFQSYFVNIDISPNMMINERVKNMIDIALKYKALYLVYHFHVTKPVHPS